MMGIFTESIGIIGMSLILVAFVLNELSGHIGRDSKEYNLFNIFGSLCLAFYAFAISSLPFLILNVVWAVTAIWKFSTLFHKKKVSLKNANH